MIFIMIFPIFYHNSVQGILHIDDDLEDVIKFHNYRIYYLITRVYLPLIKSQIKSAIQTCLPLSFKVGIMAEVFIQSEKGIGSTIYFYRTSIDMVSIFACVLWSVCLILICTRVIKQLVKE